MWFLVVFGKQKCPVLRFEAFPTKGIAPHCILRHSLRRELLRI